MSDLLKAEESVSLAEHSIPVESTEDTVVLPRTTSESEPVHREVDIPLDTPETPSPVVVESSTAPKSEPAPKASTDPIEGESWVAEVEKFTAYGSF